MANDRTELTSQLQLDLGLATVRGDVGAKALGEPSDSRPSLRLVHSAAERSAEAKCSNQIAPESTIDRLLARVKLF